MTYRNKQTGALVEIEKHHLLQFWYFAIIEGEKWLTSQRTLDELYEKVEDRDDAEEKH